MIGTCLVGRVDECVHVDGPTHVEALELLGEAWELRAFIRYRAVASYVANAKPAPLPLRMWIGGLQAWQSGASATFRSPDLTAGAGSPTLRNAHRSSRKSYPSRTARTISDAGDY